MSQYSFVQHERLGIALPLLDAEWETYDPKTQADILYQWEMNRGRIPDRIKELEQEITVLLERLGNEPDFTKCCSLNDEISKLAGTIHDLQIWYRVQQHIQGGRTHI